MMCQKKLLLLVVWELPRPSCISRSAFWAGVSLGLVAANEGKSRSPPNEGRGRNVEFRSLDFLLTQTFGHFKLLKIEKNTVEIKLTQIEVDEVRLEAGSEEGLRGRLLLLLLLQLLLLERMKRPLCACDKEYKVSIRFQPSSQQKSAHTTSDSQIS